VATITRCAHIRAQGRLQVVARLPAVSLVLRLSAVTQDPAKSKKARSPRCPVATPVRGAACAREGGVRLLRRCGHSGAGRWV
jgi:hypothetical protein